MTQIFVVGGHGYLGAAVVRAAHDAGGDVHVVNRHGGTRFALRSSSWADFLEELPLRDDARVIWLLDGAKHDEAERLGELLTAASRDAAVIAVSTCTVYGDREDGLCAEGAGRRLLTAHARLKAAAEDGLAVAPVSSCVLRLGALYGIDERGVRADRIETWVSQGRRTGVITVPDPEHWRGWLHRDQAARALYRAAHRRTTGIFNVATANCTFAQAAGTAARGTGARIVADPAPDPCTFRVDSSSAFAARLLDERPGESLAEATEAYLAATR
jgi:nucleoside-diphosphate-sugar epimerase